MAQDGDTITYTYSDGTSVEEDISGIDELTVDYMDGAGGLDGNVTFGGPGGRVENVTVDVSAEDLLYIWVASDNNNSGETGRYLGGGGRNAGSTEISFSDTDSADSADEPFLVGAGGGGSGWIQIVIGEGSLGGARGGLGVGDFDDAEGTPPPLGGDGAPDSDSTGLPGKGAIDDQNRGLVSGGATITGGGSPSNTPAEVQISYGPAAPDAPTNLTATFNK